LTYQARFQGRELAVISFPGVFSHGKLDGGTRLLLDSLEVPPGARVLDFGCGSGVIGAAAQILQPDSVVELVDSNAIALEASRRTMLVNNLVADIRPTDIFSGVEKIYTLILSNPPFHSGVQTDYRMVERFLAEAANHLDRGGRLRIVANRFLKYPPLIEKHVGKCKIVAEDRSYRVYEGQL
jgi:16S rRNA (guanine1207-N2)-methyltransferase